MDEDLDQKSRADLIAEVTKLRRAQLVVIAYETGLVASRLISPPTGPMLDATA